MKHSTVITRSCGIEEVAGKSLRDVLVLALRLGHQWPAKSERRNGIWINSYKIEQSAA